MKNMGELTCVVSRDLSRFDAKQGRAQREELATEKLADELAELTVVDFLDRIADAKRDTDRSAADRIAIQRLYETLDELIAECAGYRI